MAVDSQLKKKLKQLEDMVKESQMLQLS